MNCNVPGCKAVHRSEHPKHGWDKTCAFCGRDFDFVIERRLHERFQCPKAPRLEPAFKAERIER